MVAKVPNGVETLPKISIAWVGCTNVTDDRQTDGRWHIANVNVSSRSLKSVTCQIRFYFPKAGNDNGVSPVSCPVSPTRRKVGTVPHALSTANCPCQVARPHTKYLSPADLQYIWHWSLSDISATSLDRTRHPYEREQAAEADFLQSVWTWHALPWWATVPHCRASLIRTVSLREPS